MPADFEPAELEVPGGEQPEGEMPEGEQPEGEQPEGEQPEGEMPEGEQPEGEDPAPTPKSRAEARIHKLANERAVALAQARAAQEQVEFFRRQAELAAQGRQPPTEPEYVDPEEKWRRDMQSTVNQALFSANDTKDQAAYMMQAAKNPLYAQYADRVEAQLQKVRAQGGNATREGVLKYLVGEDAVTNHGKKTASSQQAAKRVSAARGTPPNVKSTAPAPKNEASLEERLSGIIL